MPSTPAEMRAVVVERAGPPDVLTLQTRPVPLPRPGWTLLRVRGFGLNRSEVMTRQGASGAAVAFPRVLGIEAVGTVEQTAAGSRLRPGQTVAAAMGGMGRAFDGSYAEFALLPEVQIMPLTTDLPWATLAALPETFLTAHDALQTLDPRPGQTLLVRGATSSVGLAALALAGRAGLTTLATTRAPAKVALLRARGADHVLLDSPELAAEVRDTTRGGADLVLDLVGGPALLASLKAARPGGAVVSAGLLGGQWTVPGFEPLVDIPSRTRLIAYDSGADVSAAASTQTLQRIADAVAAGELDANLGRTLPLEDTADGHRAMEDATVNGKLVVQV